MKLKTETRYIAALLPFVAKHYQPPSIQGINIRPSTAGGIVLAATDGITCGLIHDPEGSTDKETTLFFDEEAPAARKILKMFSKGWRTEDGEKYECVKSLGLEFIVEGDRARVNAKGKGNSFMFDAEYMENFPDVRRVFPHAGKTAKVTNYVINPKALENFGHAARVLKGMTAGYVKMHFTSDAEQHGFYQDPIIVTIDHPKFYGTIMPVRSVDAPPSDMPDWMKDIQS